MDSHRLFAIVPAAGLSRRMGRPKLLLPLGGRSLIVRLLDALNRPDISGCFVVVRGDDASLCAEVLAAGGEVIAPEIDPPDMRTSVQHALDEIRTRFAPGPEDGWLLIPADHPVLDEELLDLLIDCWERNDDLILVPTYQNRRGHPTFFRWKLSDEVAGLPPDRGLNTLLETYRDEVVEFPVDHPGVVTDLDTPDDYDRLQREWE